MAGNMLLPVLLLFAASAQTCAGASAPIVGTWIRATAASDAGKNPSDGQSAQTLSACTTLSEPKLLKVDAVSAPKHALWGVPGEALPMFVRPVGEEKVADKIGAPEFRNGRDVVIAPNGIECGLALVLSLLACSWMLVQTRLQPQPTKARVQTAKQASSSAASILLVLLMLLSTASVTGAEKLRPWRPVGFNPVLDVSPGSREHGRMVSFRDMVFLWGGTNLDTGKAGECALSVDREAQLCFDAPCLFLVIHVCFSDTCGSCFLQHKRCCICSTFPHKLGELSTPVWGLILPLALRPP